MTKPTARHRQLAQIISVYSGRKIRPSRIEFVHDQGTQYAVKYGHYGYLVDPAISTKDLESCVVDEFEPTPWPPKKATGFDFMNASMLIGG